MQLVTFEVLDRGTTRQLGDDRGTLADAALGFESLDISLPGVHRLGALMPPGPRSGDIIDLHPPATYPSLPRQVRRGGIGPPTGQQLLRKTPYSPR